MEVGERRAMLVVEIVVVGVLVPTTRNIVGVVLVWVERVREY